MATLMTTGYSGHDLDSFLSKLKEHEVEIVVDVRQNPVSRKKGFSRTKLSEALTAGGFEYMHAKQFGVPSHLRQSLRDGEQDLPSYLHDFRESLGEHDDALAEMYKLAVKKRCCLLCVEEHPHECHRSVVAEEVVARNGRRLEIQHI